MANYHILKIDSLLESLTLCNSSAGFRFQLPIAEDIVVFKNDLILGFITSPIDEVRYVFEVEDTTENAINLIKKCEVASGIKVDLSSIDELLPTAYLKDFMTISEKTFHSILSGLLGVAIGKRKDDSTITFDSSIPSQIIYYGCPGTGKSFKVKGLTEGLDGEKTVYFDKEGKKTKYVEGVTDKTELTTNIFRTTFHPDYDYSSFVGSYKPVMRPAREADGTETLKEELAYEFVPQVFTNAYVRAWKSLKDESLSPAEKQVYLIIEEINRGNCAQIFGDLFQLLDRKDGKSEYPIIPDAELRKHLAKEGLVSNELKLPCNLHILATMNTSDQSLFPMDSAFKRRWAMEYVPINLHHEEAGKYTFTVKDTKYSWLKFLGQVNPMIRKATDSEDKQMGEFFIKDNVTEDEFKNKVMFYIWNDVCKDMYSASRVSPLYFMRSSAGDGRENVFTFAELFGEGRRNEDGTLTSPSDLLEAFVTEKLGLEPASVTAE